MIEDLKEQLKVLTASLKTAEYSELSKIHKKILVISRRLGNI
jgi:hypothetical protein